eukprot:1168572-Pleurochrysis_carterae.AAC.1
MLAMDGRESAKDRSQAVDITETAGTHKLQAGVHTKPLQMSMPTPGKLSFNRSESLSVDWNLFTMFFEIRSVEAADHAIYTSCRFSPASCSTSTSPCICTSRRLRMVLAQLLKHRVLPF